MRDEAVGLGEMPALRRMCAWCGVELAPGTEPATHGACALCLEHIEIAVPFTDPVTRRRVGLVPVVSSNVAAAAWYALGESGVAIIKFTSGVMYRYEQVPRGWWLGFWSAESKGRYLNATLKAEPARFPCARIAERDVVDEAFPASETLGDA